jgi:Na+-driven multidrug efflux pump
MAAQNVGAGRWDRISRITGYGLGYLLAITGTMIAIILLFHEALLSLFLGDNAVAIAAAWNMQLLASWSFMMFGCTMILFGVMRANGVVVAPLLILCFTLFGVRLGFYELAYPIMGGDAVWLSFPAGSSVSLLLAWIVYARGGWRKVRLLVPVHEEQCRETANSDAEPAGRIAPVG